MGNSFRYTCLHQVKEMSYTRKHKEAKKKSILDTDTVDSFASGGPVEPAIMDK